MISPTQIPRPIHFTVLSSFAMIVLILFPVTLIYSESNVWDAWESSSELRRPAYTETVYPAHIFRTCTNTWSNLAFVLVGLYALALGIFDRREPANQTYLLRTPSASMLFGAACIYLGVGSGIFHASLTRWGQQLDVASMYAPLLAIIALLIARALAVLPKMAPYAWPATAALAIGTSIYLYIYKWSMSSGVVLPMLILTLGVCLVLDQLLFRRRLQWRWILLANVALVLAVLCRQLDVAGRFTGPDAWIQGHALWHVLCAGSLAGTYLFLRSETPRS